MWIVPTFGQEPMSGQAMSNKQRQAIRKLFKEGFTVRKIRKALGLTEEADQEILRLYGSRFRLDPNEGRTG
jgi:uncharacterized UBP type Zn finger protein